MLNLFLGVLGIVLYTLIKSRQYVYGKKRSDFNITKIYDENFLGWVWSLFALIIIWGILFLVPESSELIGSMFGGMKIENSPLGFVILGGALGLAGKEQTK